MSWCHDGTGSGPCSGPVWAGRAAPDWRQWAKVGQLVGVDDGADGLQGAVADVGADDVVWRVGGVEEGGPGLAFDRHKLDADAEPLSLPEPGIEHPGDVVAAMDRPVEACSLG